MLVTVGDDRTNDRATMQSRLQQELRDVEDGLRELAREPRRPMAQLATRFGWTDDEVGFVWAVVALAAFPRLEVHARALDDHAAEGMSVGLYTRIARLPDEIARRLGLAFVGGHSAVRGGLLLPTDGAWLPATQPFAPSTELVRHLAGLSGRSAHVDVLPVPPRVIHSSEQQRALDQLQALVSHRAPVVICVEGPVGSGRRTSTAIAAGERRAMAVDFTKLDRSPSAVASALSALRRECALGGHVEVIVGIEEIVVEQGSDPRLRLLVQHLEAADGPVVCIAARRGLELATSLPLVRVEWPVPDVRTRTSLLQHVAEAPAAVCETIAHRFRMGVGPIQRAAASARVIAEAPVGPLTSSQIVAGIRQNLAERMGGLAERVVVKQSWEDLVLNEDVLAQVRALVARVEHAHMVYEQWGYRAKVARGTGIAAMFSGPPGTGKTMVAGLIANELELELYQVDLSKVVSKWVGETEKQLSKLFDAADEGHVLLLFDEADALFGQRSSEVKGATDRYANLEVNFLLQRVESLNGLAILTTNLAGSVDKALKRRLASHVVFPSPDDDERALLWKRMITAEGAPVEDVDTAALAREFPKMTGANIRNAALAAAFLAAAESRSTINHATVLRAARGEYISMGHVLSAGRDL